MAKESKRDSGGKIVDSSGTTETPRSGQRATDKDFVWVREDGAICFGDECATIAPTETGRLGLTIRPTQCGAEIGSLLVDYLTRTAGKGVVIEIPSEFKDMTKEKKS